MSKALSLEEILDINSFQKIQDDIAYATDMAIITVDYKGKPVTNHSNCSEFCKTMRDIKEYSYLCERCDSRGALESARTKKPYIYRCHKGLIDFATPIIVNEQYLGAVMVGQVYIEDDVELEEIVPVKTNFENLDHNLKSRIIDLYNNQPKLSFDKVKSIAQMMFHISNYIVGEAVLKMAQKDLKNKINLEPTEEKENKETFYMENKIDNKDNYENILKDTTVDNVNYQINDDYIVNALDYIEDNIHENITLEKISSICNISQCYFSKLFKKETGVNFITYVNNKKISKAKEMLENTDDAIANIALDLGFDDCGYFIRVFKNSEKVTPKKYRENHIKK